MTFLDRFFRRRPAVSSPVAEPASPSGAAVADVRTMESHRNVAGLIWALRTRTTHVDGEVLTEQDASGLMVLRRGGNHRVTIEGRTFELKPTIRHRAGNAALRVGFRR